MIPPKTSKCNTSKARKSVIYCMTTILLTYSIKKPVLASLRINVELAAAKDKYWTQQRLVSVSAKQTTTSFSAMGSTTSARSQASMT